MLERLKPATQKGGEVSVRMSVASCRASQFGPPVGFFDAGNHTARNRDPSALWLV